MSEQSPLTAAEFGPFADQHKVVRAVMMAAGISTVWIPAEVIRQQLAEKPPEGGEFRYYRLECYAEGVAVHTVPGLFGPPRLSPRALVERLQTDLKEQGEDLAAMARQAALERTDVVRLQAENEGLAEEIERLREALTDALGNERIDVAVMRTAVADLWGNIGCGCCCSDTTEQCYKRLAELLGVPPQPGPRSGYSWDQYETKPVAEP